MGMAATQTRDLNRTLTTKIRERNIIFAEYQANKEEANAMMNFEMQVVAEERADRAETIKFMQDKYNSLKTDEMWQKEKDYQTEAARIAYER
jgi:type IV secretory pathway VirB9-like protein